MEGRLPTPPLLRSSTAEGLKVLFGVKKKRKKVSGCCFNPLVGNLRNEDTQAVKTETENMSAVQSVTSPGFLPFLFVHVVRLFLGGNLLTQKKNLESTRSIIFSEESPHLQGLFILSGGRRCFFF